MGWAPLGCVLKKEAGRRGAHVSLEAEKGNVLFIVYLSTWSLLIAHYNSVIGPHTNSLIQSNIFYRPRLHTL